MELNMGIKISSLRRERGMTQEQLAAALGVSAPAVSKWETNNSYPDITLLCPLARALGTDVDNLLTFEEELSQEKLGQYMAEIVEIARQGKVSWAEEKLNELLHRYPSDIPLKFSAIAVLSFFEMNSDLGVCGADQSVTDISNTDSCSITGTPGVWLSQTPDMQEQNKRETCQDRGGEKGQQAVDCYKESPKEQQNRDCCKEGYEGKDRQRWARQKKELAQALHDDGNPAFYLSAVSLLVSLALADGELAEAERLLKENLTNQADFTALWVKLYLQKGEHDQALGTLQRQAYKLVTDLRTCLMYLMREDIGLERDRVIEICSILEQIDSLFSVGGNMGAGLYAEVYLRLGEQEKALDYLERLADQMTGQIAPPNPLVFAPAIAPETEKLKCNRELKLIALQGLQKDACFEPLRSLERFQALVQRVAESLEVKLPNTNWCNITGKTCDMHVEESLDVAHPNTD